MSLHGKPLVGLRAIEFTHMVMGPTVGLILADLGAEVIKVEPIGGDKTRRLGGSGAGYFPMYNRNKKSVALDLKSDEGRDIALRLVDSADIFVENFRPGALDALGFGYDALSKRNPGLVYCSEKGFLDGPYAHRTALDEVAQMMGGLAYMTGPPGRPLRAGASVIDVGGGMFGAIAILSALHQRSMSGTGQYVSSALFETTAFFVGQHIAQKAVTGVAAAPMPARVSAWAVYDVFDVKNDQKVFVGVVSDSQWAAFCAAFDLEDWAEDPDLATNTGRVARREYILPRLRDLFCEYSSDALMAKLELCGLPFAPISRPQDLCDDPHLNANGGLIEMTLADGKTAKLPSLPISMAGVRHGLYANPPRIGEHTSEILASLDFSARMIEDLCDRQIAQVDTVPPDKADG